MDTDAFIRELAGDAAPVRRLLSPWTRTVLWVAIATPFAIVAVASHGFEAGQAAALADLRIWIELAATFLTAVTAAAAAFESTVPGSNRRWLWLPVPPLVVWLLTVGDGCLDEWWRLGPAALELHDDSGCFALMVAISAVPAVAMLLMLRRGAPLTPRLTLVLGTLAVAAFANVALRLFHLGDVSFMLLVWHFAILGVLLALACLFGPRLIGWRPHPSLSSV
jgi:hypothetical protein